MAEVWVHGAVGGRERAIEQAMIAAPEVSDVLLDYGDMQVGLDRFSGNRLKPLVVVGPEAPLAEGAADYLREAGFPVFGASQAQAQYEASKSFTTKMARQAGILHPHTYIAEGEDFSSKALDYIFNHPPESYVIKADGLIGGKGVVLPKSYIEAEDTVKEMLYGMRFKNAGRKAICFQRRIDPSNPEVSVMIIVGRGKDDFVLLPLTQDHKRLLEGDRGPNTGGMGAYGPVPSSIVNDDEYGKIEEKSYNSLDGMEKFGVPYDRACLYMGLMKGNNLTGPQANDTYLIENNVRFGDPEFQVLASLLVHAGVNVYRLLYSAAVGELEHPNVDFRNIGYSAVSVCLAGRDYPDKPQEGTLIHGLDREYEGVSVQLAGVTRGEGPIRTNGGRILYVSGVGETIDLAAERAYRAIGPDGIHFEGMQYRPDIGWQARTPNAA